MGALKLPAAEAAKVAIQSIGCGYDISLDLRLKYCKGHPANSRLIEIDENEGREVVLPGGISIPSVSKSIKCDKGELTRFRSDVLSFQQMSEQFNQELSVNGKIPSGLFNTMFETAKLLLSPLSVPWGFHTPHSRQHLLSLRTGRRTRFTVQAFNNVLFSAAPLLIQENSSSLFSLATTAADAGYSMASYYTSLGLFVISVPGLWSLIKRSVKSKIVQKTFVKQGTEEAKQVAGEILSFFTRNNFAVLDRGETITFEGMMVPSRGQAALLTFCTCISLGSVALVLTITVPDVGNNWFWITALSPLAGVYYWTRASRKEQIKVKMIVADNGSLSEIVVQGDDQEVEKMRKELQLSEKGMVYVKGLFER